MHEAHLTPFHGMSIAVYCASIHRNNVVNRVIVHNELILYLLKQTLPFPRFLPSLPCTLAVTITVSETAVCFSFFPHFFKKKFQLFTTFL